MPVTNLGAKVENHDFDRANITLGRSNYTLERSLFDGIQDVACCSPALRLYVGHHCVETFFIAATAQYGVIALGGEPLAGGAADTCPCAYN